MQNGYSRKFPLSPAPDACKALGPIQLQVESAEGVQEFDPNSLILAILREPGCFGTANPSTPSELSGAPGFIYRTNEVELRLSLDELRRLTLRALNPPEFFALAKAHGIFFELHDDFYDETTGEALQPNI